jgi:tryptophan 2,3-dioxygenase
MECAFVRARADGDGAGSITEWAARARGTDEAGLARLLGSFPYFALLERWHRAGKAFVPTNELEELDAVWRELRARRIATRAFEILDSFFSLLLDRHRGRYSYESAIGMEMIERLSLPSELPSREHAEARIGQARILLADLLAFEAASHLDGPPWAGGGVPPLAAGLRRVRLLRAALARIDPFALAPDEARAAADTPTGREDDDVGDAALRIREGLAEASVVLRSAPEETLFLFRLSLIPVSTRHDEVMFLRMLQIFELLFTIVLRRVREAIVAVRDAEPGVAARALTEAATVTRKSPLLFRVLFTMTRESFATFRDLTRGSSAIQSRQYKLIELLCARPDPARLGSLAFATLTEDELADGTLEEALAAYEARHGEAGRDGGLAALRRSMVALEREIVVWKRTHHRLAERMIGDLPGTGGTEGAEYLRRYVDSPLFPSLRGRRRGRSVATSRRG